VFFALVPPPSLRQTLALLAGAVAQGARGRPMPAENLHVTVAFVGAWPLSGLSRWIDAGERCAGAPMHITLDALGGFRRASVAWIGARVAPAPLLDLGRSLNTELADAGIVEERQFHPHLTLARKCRGPFPRRAVGPYEWDVDALALMQSHADAAGTRYAVLRQWRLT
jgi:2'-5' RNA ligase